jgi:hypothetical protein
MTELADRALISRSGMTRRVARLVDMGLDASGTKPCVEMATWKRNL